MGAALSSLCSEVCRAAYGISLLVNMLWTTALMKVIDFLPLSVATRQGSCLALVQLAWRLALFTSPWVACRADADLREQWSVISRAMAESDEECKREGVPFRPLFILANHASFFDTVLGVVAMPRQVLWRCRTYMDHHLFKLPILSTVCRTVGHFPVYFQSDQDGVFKVDAKRMEEVDQRVNAHLRAGGWLCFFPEGQMNKSPDTLLPFRYGGLKKALEMDARLVSLVFNGNTEVWPRKAKVGGFPGRVHYCLRLLAPRGARAFVAEARAEGVPEEKDMADHEILARRTHALMQAQYDELATNRSGRAKRD